MSKDVEPKIKEVTVPVSLLGELINLIETNGTGNVPFNHVAQLTSKARQCIRDEFDKVKKQESE
jgi:hypothetical protein